VTVTFADMLLSAGGFGGDETWQTRFTIKGSQDVQVCKPMRADYVRVIARGQRMLTITLLFRPPSCADVHESFAELALYFSTLPQQGDLVLESGGNRVPYPDACLVSFDPPPRVGVSNEFPLVFQTGQPGELVRLVLDEDGVVLTDEEDDELEF
jgi:hypothetical protein